MTRYIIRPPGILSTPKQLRRILKANKTARAGSVTANWDWDFFTYYPHPSQVRNANDAYRNIYAFSSANKREQRRQIALAGIPIPQLAEVGSSQRLSRLQHERTNSDTPTKYIVRPLRHMGGQGWRITEEPTDYDPLSEYVQELFPKRHEYRLLYFKGELIATLYKQVPDHLTPDMPWNHAQGSRFITVNHEENNRLRRYDVREKLNGFPIIKSAHLVGVDILLGKKKDGYVVTELNFCPSISIPGTLERIQDAATTAQS